MQGNHHIKRLDTFAVDSKPTLRRPYLWFAERHLLAGFANTLDRSLCNCKFITVGDRIFLESTKPLLAGMEVFAFYERTDQATPGGGRRMPVARGDWGGGRGACVRAWAGGGAVF